MEKLLSEFFESKTGNEKKVLEELINSGIKTTSLLVANKNEILNGIKGAKKKIVIQFISEICGKEEIIQINTENDLQPEISIIENHRTIFEQLIAGKVRLNNLVPNRLQGRFPEDSLYSLSKMTNEEARRRGLRQVFLNELYEFQEKIRIQPELYIEYYRNNFEKSELPINYDNKASLYDSIYMILCDYATKIETNGNKDNIRDAQMLRMYYGIGDYDLHSTIEISKVFGYKKDNDDRVRQILFTDSKRLSVKELFNGKKVNHQIIHSDLLDEMKRVISLSIYSNKFRELICDGKECGNEKLNRIAEIFNLGLIEEDGQEYLVDRNEIRSFRDHYRAISQTVNQIVFAITKEQLSKLVEEELNKEFEFNNIFFESFLKQHQYLEVIETENEIKYQCKWKYLSSVDSKAKRIVFESENQQLGRKSILTEFNNKESQLQLEFTQDTQLIIKTGGGFIAQANGVWRYDSSADKAVLRISLKSVLEEYISLKNGKITFQDAKNHLKENNLSYPDNSVRSTLTNLCLIARKDKQLFIMDKYANKYPEIELTPREQKDVRYNFANFTIMYLKELQSRKCNFKDFRHEILKRLSTIGIEIKHLPNFEAYISYLSSMGILHDSKENGVRFIYLNETELDKHDLKTLGKQAKPNYQKEIRSLAINYLKEKENFECPLSELSNEFISFVKDGIKPNIFYTIFNDKFYFQKSGKGRNRIIRLEKSHLPVAKTYLEDVINPEIDSKPISEKIIVDERQVLPNDEIYISIPFDWTVLKLQMKKELAEYGFKDEVLEIGINSFYNSLGGYNIDRWGKSILKCLSDFWFKSNDYFDRESYILKLAHGFETYLKIFIPITHPTDGLASAIDFLQEVKSLKSYKFECKDLNWYEIDKQKQNLSYILGTVSFIGNKFRHDGKNESLDMANIKQAKTITDIAALYVYTAYILNIY